MESLCGFLHGDGFGNRGVDVGGNRPRLGRWLLFRAVLVNIRCIYFEGGWVDSRQQLGMLTSDPPILYR